MKIVIRHRARWFFDLVRDNGFAIMSSNRYGSRAEALRYAKIVADITKLDIEEESDD